MNRRSFIKGLVSSFFILPSATTYAREWIKNKDTGLFERKYVLVASEEALAEFFKFEKLPSYIVQTQVKYLPQFAIWNELANDAGWLNIPRQEPILC